MVFFSFFLISKLWFCPDCVVLPSENHFLNKIHVIDKIDNWQFITSTFSKILFSLSFFLLIILYYSRISSHSECDYYSYTVLFFPFLPILSVFVFLHFIRNSFRSASAHPSSSLKSLKLFSPCFGLSL
jgi:hypothetical protein